MEEVASRQPTLTRGKAGLGKGAVPPGARGSMAPVRSPPLPLCSTPLPPLASSSPYPLHGVANALRNQPHQMEEHQPGAGMWSSRKAWKKAVDFLHDVPFIQLRCQGHPVQAVDV